MAAMTTHNDEISTDLTGHIVDFNLRSAEHQVLIFRGNAPSLGKLSQVDLRGLLNLFLDGGQIHRYITTVGKAEGFDDVNATEVCIERLRQGAGPLGHGSRFFG